MAVINPNRLLPSAHGELNFWQRLLSDKMLQPCENLEKLLVGCEIIAALDDLSMLDTRALAAA